MSDTEKEHTPQQFQLDDLTIDLAGYRITRAGGSIIRITQQEQRLLRALLSAHGRVLMMEELGREAWDWPAGYPAHGIWRCVARLRRKLGDDGERQRYIKTIRGVGFCIDPPVSGGRDVH